MPQAISNPVYEQDVSGILSETKAVGVLLRTEPSR